jgi:hypothetical protein
MSAMHKVKDFILKSYCALMQKGFLINLVKPNKSSNQ